MYLIMLKLILFIVVVSISFFACSKEVKTKEEQKKTISKMSLIIDHKKSVEVSTLAKKEIESWNEYNDLKDFLSRFHKISPTEALNVAIELKDLTKTMRDSLKIKDLKVNALKARINVFQNEVLRLVDMTLIPAIKDYEVNNQIDKVLLVFSSLNEKINTIYSKKEFDKEVDLENFFELEKDDETSKNKFKNLKQQ